MFLTESMRIMCLFRVENIKRFVPVQWGDVCFCAKNKWLKLFCTKKRRSEQILRFLKDERINNKSNLDVRPDDKILDIVDADRSCNSVFDSRQKVSEKVFLLETAVSVESVDKKNYRKLKLDRNSTMHRATNVVRENFDRVFRCNTERIVSNKISD